MRTVADEVADMLRKREAARAVRDAAVAAAEAQYRTTWTPEAEQALDLAASLANLDERPPEAPRISRRRAPKPAPVEG